MKPEDEQFQEHMKTLEVIFDRMGKAGLIVGHGNRDDPKRIAAEFTPEGLEVVNVIYALDETLGPLTPKQIIYFWKYIVKFAKSRNLGD